MSIRIGVLNLMPEPELYEPRIKESMLGSGLPIEISWVRLEGRSYSRSDVTHIQNNYSSYSTVVANGPLHGLIVTGAALEHLPYQQVTLMPEINEIVQDSMNQGASVLGLCWGALAIGYLRLGISKHEYSNKLFGVFETETVAKHVFSSGFDDRFWSPHSRYAGFCEEEVHAAVEAGRLLVLARSEKAGSVILATADCKVLLHAGHPEYDTTRLVEEYARDCSRGLTNIGPPQNVNLERPLNLWRSNSRVFFYNWVHALSDFACRTKIGVSASGPELSVGSPVV